MHDTPTGRRVGRPLRRRRFQAQASTVARIEAVADGRYGRWSSARSAPRTVIYPHLIRQGSPRSGRGVLLQVGPLGINVALEVGIPEAISGIATPGEKPGKGTTISNRHSVVRHIVGIVYASWYAASYARTRWDEQSTASPAACSCPPARPVKDLVDVRTCEATI